MQRDSQTAFYHTAMTVFQMVFVAKLHCATTRSEGDPGGAKAGGKCAARGPRAPGVKHPGRFLLRACGAPHV